MQPSNSFTLQFDRRTNVLVDQIQVSEAHNPTSGLPIPQLHSFSAIWDTGASNCVISARVVAALGIEPIGKIKTLTANGERLANTYLVNIYLRNKVVFSGVRVTEGDLVGNEDLLLGMDIIGMGDFSVTCSDGKTCMSFRIPSIKRIDYVEEHQRNAPRAPLSPDEARKARNKAKRKRHGRH